jgi:hypothetical protein
MTMPDGDVPSRVQPSSLVLLEGSDIVLADYLTTERESLYMVLGALNIKVSRVPLGEKVSIWCHHGCYPWSEGPALLLVTVAIILGQRV